MAKKDEKCYLCDGPSIIELTKDSARPNTKIVGCLKCLPYRITNDAIEKLRQYRKKCLYTENTYGTRYPALVSLKHRVHDRRRQEIAPEIVEDDVNDAFAYLFQSIGNEQDMLPIPLKVTDLSEQVGRFVCLLMEEARKFGGYHLIVPDFDREGMMIGSCNPTEFENVLEHMRDNGFVSVNKDTGEISLTVKGEEHCKKVKKGGLDSRQVFMAMAFNKEDLHKAKKHFQIAVERAGFKLVFADEMQEVGLIVERIRDAIRKSAFVIADLSHGNQGAYFEAGCADGEGKHVIYTCNKDTWDNKKLRDRNVHFDVNHYRIIIWDPEDLRTFESELESAIKVALRNS